jgi:hypothetical protein
MQYDAAAFLTGLFRSATSAQILSTAPNSVRALAPTDLPPEWHLLWEERAAIMEYDGGLPLEQAEALALADIAQVMKRTGTPPGHPPDT